MVLAEPPGSREQSPARVSYAWGALGALVVAIGATPRAHAEGLAASLQLAKENLDAQRATPVAVVRNKVDDPAGEERKLAADADLRDNLAEGGAGGSASAEKAESEGRKTFRSAARRGVGREPRLFYPCARAPRRPFPAPLLGCCWENFRGRGRRASVGKERERADGATGARGGRWSSAERRS